jgi:hypothetical protein
MTARLHNQTKKKRLKLTAAQKKAIWANEIANAGAGWKPKYHEPTDPITFLKEDDE